MLPDEPLPELSNEEQEVVRCFLVAAEECKDLEGGVGLGTTFCELPEEVTLGAGTTLTAPSKTGQRKRTFRTRITSIQPI